MAEVLLQIFRWSVTGLTKVILKIAAIDDKHSGCTLHSKTGPGIRYEYDRMPTLKILLRRSPNFIHLLTSGFVRFNITLLS